jgi:transposase
MKEPKKIELTEIELNALREKILSNNLSENDKSLLCDVLQFFLWIQEAYQSKKNIISRLLSKIFGSKTEKKGSRKQKNGQDVKENKDDKNSDSPKPKPGHGRNGADKFTGAKSVICNHDTLKPGDTCPECEKGRVYDIAPGSFIKITGNSILDAIKFSLQKLKCNLCGEIFEAPLPDGITKEKWDPTAKATTAVMKYGYGLPQYRQEKILNDHGLPISDSTLYDKSEEVADAIRPVIELLKTKAAQSDAIIHTDDTKSKIQELLKQNKEETLERVGIFTTVTATQSDGKTIILYTTGRNNAGENLDNLFTRRDPLKEIPRIMVDGSSSNFPENFKVIVHNCLTHARREFVDIETSFPTETQIIISILSKIYGFDAETKKMSFEKRLAYHIKHSQPLVDQLEKHLLNFKKIAEPNSDLGKAVRYSLNRWKELTRFLHVLGAPLDNNLAERIIKKFVLFRKNSYFYKTNLGALVGDILMSAIQTSIFAKVSPIHYLTQVQIHKRAVFKNPEKWLAWNYMDNFLGTTQNTT